MSAPAVSIIIPTHNYAEFIGDALDSVRRQTLADYELWVMDDGSTDDTPAIVASYQKVFGERLHYVRSDKNRGVYAIRNQALEKAAGRYIAFLDADDIWMDTHLADLTGYLEKHPEDMMVYANARFFYHGADNDLGTQFGSGSLKTPRIGACAAALFSEGNFIPFMTTVLRREAFQRAGRFDESLRVGGDYALFMRIAARDRIGYVDKVLVRVRRHNKNLSFMSLLQARTQLRILRDAASYFKENGIAIPEVAARKRQAELYYQLAVALVMEGRHGRARKFLCGAWKLDPAAHKRKVTAYYLLTLFPWIGSLKDWRTRWHILREKWRIRNR